MRIGILQFSVEKGNRQANFQTVHSMTESAMCAQTAPIVLVLPELWSTGYALENAAELATPFGNGDAEFLGRIARKYRVSFAGGSVLASVPLFATASETASGRHLYFNRSQVIGSDGSYLAAYDKIHLFKPMGESRYLMRGNAPVWYNLCGMRCASVICYDIRFCELIRRLAVGGAEMLFVSAEWPIERIAHWEALLRARAIENQMYIAACNRCGITDGVRFGGHSMIIAPDGTVLAQAGDDEAVITAEVDSASVASIRDGLPVFSDRVPELY